MDTQEAYERMREYFSRPDAVLAKIVWNDAGATCSYRDENGNKCAVGCLISDELYDSYLEEKQQTLGEAIEGAFVGLIINESPILKELLNGEDSEGARKLAFLSKSQYLHDNQANTPEHFIDLLDDLASSFDLKVPVA